MKRAGQALIFVLCVVFSVSAAYNVLADNTEVEKAARAVACAEEGPTCSTTLTRLARTPLGQSMTFTSRKGKTVDVCCVRSLVLVGEYACSIP
ncbi:hypothetical protein [Chondromyces crocatus]|uniref:Secreted protein n=1 Tax=Chondromyces crocatus TaxID=52 RepID=A0A0K1EJK9_CHOCO|nr:hypothetical protein [Chondromyces crocatus]AKT41044.1 uncharacterized protein CMC5_052020 [Chondromyces crocatus]